MKVVCDWMIVFGLLANLLIMYICIKHHIVLELTQILKWLMFFVEVVTPNSRKITSKRLQSAFNKKMTSMSSHVPGRRSLGEYFKKFKHKKIVVNANVLSPNQALEAKDTINNKNPSSFEWRWKIFVIRRLVRTYSDNATWH